MTVDSTKIDLIPARLNTTETAVLLGFKDHDINPLVTAKLLAPLGTPAPNAPKYFAAVIVEALAHDPNWLGQATKALAKFCTERNHGKTATKLRAVKPDEDQRVA